MIHFLPVSATPKRNSRTRERFGDDAPNYIMMGRNRAIAAESEVNRGLGLPDGDWFEIDSGRSIVASREHAGRRYYMNSPLVNYGEVSRWMDAAHRAGHAPEHTVVTPTVVATSAIDGHVMDEEHFGLVEEALRAVHREFLGTVRSVNDLLTDREVSGRRRAGDAPDEQETLASLLGAVGKLRNSPLPDDFVCHGDLVSGNVYIEHGRVVFIDPEPFAGHVYYDLAKLANSLGTDVRRGEERDLLDTIKLLERNSRALYRHQLSRQAQD